jgi:hypothetical protein
VSYEIDITNCNNAIDHTQELLCGLGTGSLPGHKAETHQNSETIEETYNQDPTPTYPKDFFLPPSLSNYLG